MQNSYFCGMKILITGATGLIGGEIIDLCKSRGIGVNYLTTRKDKIVKGADCKGFYWNPAKGEIDLTCFKGISAIINLAGASISKRWTPRYKSKILSSRLNSQRTLHRALKKIDVTQIESFISASAVGVYPNSLTNFYEETEKRIDDSFLGEVVKVWENETDKFNEFDFLVSKVRIGLVLSENGGALPEIARPIQHYVGASFGTGEQWQSWVHIADLARIFLFVVDHRLKGVYNGVAPNPVTNNKLVKEIANKLKKPLILPNIPQLALKVLLGEMSYILFASQRVSSKKVEEKGFVFDYPNICMALESIYGNGVKENRIDTLFNKEYI